MIKWILTFLAIYFIFNFFRQFEKVKVRSRHRRRDPNESFGGFKGPRFESPYEILGVSHGATSLEIKRAYRQKLAEYHPDKVAHLGEELQNLAREKTQQINQAFHDLS